MLFTISYSSWSINPSRYLPEENKNERSVKKKKIGVYVEKVCLILLK